MWVEDGGWSLVENFQVCEYSAICQNAIMNYQTCVPRNGFLKLVDHTVWPFLTLGLPMLPFAVVVARAAFPDGSTE